LLAWKYGNKDGFICPDQETLAADLHKTVRTVRKALAELRTIGLKIEYRRGPRSGKALSFYSFGDPPISEKSDLNAPGISEERDLNNPPNLGNSRQQFGKKGDQNLGSQRPPNQKIEPKEGTKGGRACAREAPPPDTHFFENGTGQAASEAEPIDGEVIPPRTNGPGSALSAEDWAYAASKGLTEDETAAEAEKFAEAKPNISWRLWVIRQAEWKARHPQRIVNGRGERMHVGDQLAAEARAQELEGRDPATLTADDWAALRLHHALTGEWSPQWGEPPIARARVIIEPRDDSGFVPSKRRARGPP
jgi:Helix-turn-helix domain